MAIVPIGFLPSRAAASRRVSFAAQGADGGTIGPPRGRAHPVKEVFCATPVEVDAYRQAPFPASGRARKLMVAGAKVTSPAAVGAPETRGRSPFASTASSAPFN